MIDSTILNPVTLLLCFAFGVLWVYQFSFLMLLSKEDFPNEHDKIIWAAVFVLVPFLSPFAFRLWRKATISRPNSENQALPAIKIRPTTQDS